MLKLTTFLDVLAATLDKMVLLLTVMTEVGEGRGCVRGAAAAARLLPREPVPGALPPKITGTVRLMWADTDSAGEADPQ